MKSPSKQSFWLKHVRAWESSGVSQAVYCQRHRLSLASFGYWRQRCKQDTDASPAVIPIVREPVIHVVQLRSPGGWQIALPASMELGALRALLTALP